MNPEHVSVFIRGSGVCVRDSPLRVIEGEPVAVDGAREVHVFGVHEIPFVEESCFYCRLRAKEHETAAQVRCIDRA